MKKNLYFGVIAVILFILYIIINIFKTNLIVSMGIGFVKIIQNILIFLIVFCIGYVGFNIYKGVRAYNKASKELHEKKDVYSSKRNYTNIEDIKKEINKLYNSIQDSEEGIIAKRILNTCKHNLDSIEKLQAALDIILNRSEEYSLEEVINTIKQAEQSIGKNTFKITNRIVLELGIEGFDETQINRYVSNNIEIVNECTKLVKEALSYIESKDTLDHNVVGIESLTETLQKLKTLNNKEVE